MFESSLLLRGVFLLLLPALSIPSFAGDTAVQISQGTDVVTKWKADQHLYVKGNLGLSAQNLDGLEKWLDQNAPNWTIVLLQNASGESFPDDREGFAGMDAVEHALGKGLPARTDFGTLRHKASAEANGAFFVLFLQERKFSYFASDVYDKRGLGEDRWLGNLDVHAIRAMRSGGRIVDAVKDTVSHIDGQLQQSFARVEAEKRRAEEDARRLKAETGAMIEEMRQRIGFAEDRAAGLRRDYPGANGLLIAPATKAWTTAIESAAQLLAGGNAALASRAVGKAKSELDDYLREVARHAAGKNDMAALRQKLNGVRLLEQSVAAQEALVKAGELLFRAETAHQNAESAFARLLDQAAEQWAACLRLDQETRRIEAQIQQAEVSLKEVNRFPESSGAEMELDKARQVVARAKDEFAAGKNPGAILATLGEHLQRSVSLGAEDERRAAKSKAMAVTGGSASGAAALLLGWLGNRRRRKVRDQAETLLTSWETTFAGKTDGLFALLDHAGTSIGTAAQLERSGWTGETHRLASQTISDVDQLFIMSSSVDRVLDQVRKLVRPGEPIAGGVNLVSGKNYEKGIHLLTEAKIAFGPDDPLQPILNHKTQKPWSGLLGKREDCVPFALSFDELIAAFDERAQRAVTSLETIDQAWLKIHPALKDLDDLLDKEEAREKSIHDAGKEDRLFILESLFDALLPSAREEEAAAVKLSATDPVQALVSPVAKAKRKAADADALCDTVEAARRDLFPLLTNAEAILKQASRQTEWIGAKVRHLSLRSDALGHSAVENPASKGIDQLASDLLSLAQRATQSVALQQCSEEQKLNLDALESRILTDRGRFAATLGVSADLLLREEEWHPDKTAQSANEAFLAALAQLDRGAVEPAKELLEEMKRQVLQGTAILDDTQQALQSYETDSQHLAREHARISALRTPQLALLEDLQKRYAAEALTTTNGTLSEFASRADECIAASAAAREQAQERHFSGNILAAARFQEAAEKDQKEAEFSWLEISRHADLLADLERENRTTLETHEAWQRGNQSMVEHAHTRRQSMALAEQVGAALAAARRAVEAVGTANHPRQARDLLIGVKNAQDELLGQIQADHALFQTAKAAVTAAEDQLQRTKPSVEKSQTDQIRDSSAMTESLRILAELKNRWETCRSILETSHAEWAEVQAGAGEISREVARQRAILQGELDQAAEALQRIRAAASTVDEGGRWRGFFTGNPGADELRSAEHLLGIGNYQAAIHHAISAERQARAAIEAAEAEQRRRRAEERRREEEQRRQQSAAQRSFASSLSSSSHRSSSSSSSSSSHSSGSSRSGFSSGSGTSRSGW